MASKAVDLGVKATVAVGKATFAAGKYAHKPGLDECFECEDGEDCN